MAGLYIHIPFCRSRCAYCDFHRETARGDRAIAALAEAIGREMTARSGELGTPPRTLYFGGGTPSLCTPAQIDRLIRQARRLWPGAAFEEITLEANPDDLTRDPAYLPALRTAGVDRLSLGIQSFHDAHLRRMNRRHTAAQALEAVGAAQQAGFGNISIDLIYGLPFSTPGEWRRNLETAASLDVQHISAYHLTIEGGSAFACEGMQPVGEERSEQDFGLLRSILLNAGFEHYEVSNFALPGRRAVHNALYWAGEEYLGLGPAAHSFTDGARSWNVADNEAYLAGAPRGSETLSPADRLNEYLMVRLRTADGFSVSYVKSAFGEDEVRRVLSICERFLASGEMVRGAQPHGQSLCDGQNEYIRIKPEHFLVSDYIIAQLFV